MVACLADYTNSAIAASIRDPAQQPPELGEEIFPPRLCGAKTLRGGQWPQVMRLLDRLGL